ncbi:MAG: Ig-like domain repeat protein, partial [Acidobacteria bacterium]|nr:Ig-like domain repeat protein [Acidobacteriota bacterium]
PAGGVIQDAAGNFYGATSGGGGQGSGTVFRLDPAGRETVLHSFCSVANCADGSNPQAGVIQDTAGSLYGTTNSGGNAGGGTVFRLDSAGHLTVLHAFCSAAHCMDGANPAAGVVEDAAGNLYGTTALGGRISQLGPGYGSVFKLDTRLKVAGFTLTSSPNPSFVGQPVVLSVDVSGQSETPTGVVTFKQGTVILSTNTLSAGRATMTMIFPSHGNVGISAQYAGDLYNLAAKVPLKQVVNRWPTSTAITSSPNPSTHGQLVTLTAEVSSLGGPPPSGHVIFMNGSTVLRNVPVNNGVAQISNLPVGTLSLTATYTGDFANETSTSPVLSQVVN